MQVRGETISNRWTIATIVVILAVGTTLRFYGLDNQSLWNDELSSWRRSHHDDLATVIQDSVQFDVHPPGYQVLLYFVERGIGDTETILRMPSAVSGVLTILAIFVLGRQVYSSREGLIAAGLMAVLWYPVYYSQEARPYMIVLLLTLVSTSLWIAIARAVRHGMPPSKWLAFGYILAAVLLAYFRYTGLYLVLLQGLGLFIYALRKRRGLTAVLLIYMSIYIAYSPWLSGFWTHLTVGAAWTQAPPRPALVGYFQNIFNQSRPLTYVVFAMWLILLVMTLVRQLQSGKAEALKESTSSPGLLLAIWLLVPIATTYALPPVNGAALYRNLVICLPPAYLLLSRSITRLPIGSSRQSAIALLVVTVVAGQLIYELDYYSKPHKEQFREAVAYVVENDPHYEDSLFVGYAWHKLYFDYYLDRMGSQRRLDVFASRPEDVDLVMEAITERDPSYVWFVRAHKKPEPEYLDFFNETLTPVNHHPLIGADVWLYRAEY